MVRGLDYFRRHFASYSDRYVLIGGTACTLLMEDVGLNFRATKDLDIVLHVEALDAKFTLVTEVLKSAIRYISAIGLFDGY